MKANEDNLNVECTGCGAKMSNADFNQHQCPNITIPISGESFEDYKKRNAVHQASKEDDLDNACRIIQEAYGIKTGDIAALFFCGREDDWNEGSIDYRTSLITRYIKREEEEIA